MKVFFACGMFYFLMQLIGDLVVLHSQRPGSDPLYIALDAIACVVWIIAFALAMGDNK